MLIRCPCCRCEVEKTVVYSKRNCPAINNVVYRTKEEALNCAAGDIELVLCCECGFVFNFAYREDMPDYDRDYNSVRSYSPAYRDYLGGLVDLCTAGVGAGARILEIGCGEGDFLKRLRSATGARGVGYDPSCREEEEDGIDGVRLVRGYFDGAESEEKFDMVVLRHVLEHVPGPYGFLEDICRRGVLARGAKLLIEVPDFEWILDEGAYFDITYEHCNYFFKKALGVLLELPGVEVVSLRNVFGGQYILAEAVYGGEAVKVEAKRAVSVEGLKESFGRRRREHRGLIGGAESVCVWGASGKGVIFLSELPEAILAKVRYVIDINPDKQGGFLPGSGKRVAGCDVLRGIDGELLVMVMNEVYEEEIKKTLDEMGVRARLCVA